MAEMKSQHAVEVKRLEEEGMRRGAKASLASERREIELRGKIIDAAQKARKHIFQHQMAESKISSGALPSLTLAGHEKSLAEEVQEAQEALQSEREVAQMASLTLWMMATGRKAASFISATGEFHGILRPKTKAALGSRMNPLIPRSAKFMGASANCPASCKRHEKRRRVHGILTKIGDFRHAAGEAASAPHALLVTLQHDPDFRDLVFESCGQELCAHLTLACVD